MAWTSPRTWVTSEFVTAALLNTHLRDNLNDIAFNGHMARGFAQDLTGSTISTTPTVELSTTLSIPASWGGYDVYASMTLRCFESGALTGDRLMTHEIRLTNAAGTLMGRTRDLLGQATPDHIHSVAINGRLLSATATGSVIICYVATAPADTGQASWDDGSLQAIAYRTS